MVRLGSLAVLTAVAVNLWHSESVQGQENSEKSKSIQVTVSARGAHCDACVEQIRQALGKLEAIKFDKEKLQAGEKPRYFTDPFVVTIKDRTETHVGALAEAVGKAKTPHKDDAPPGINLVLYTPTRIDEGAIVTLRDALRKVNGVEVREDVPAGLGGFPNKGYVWIKLENAGGAALKDILDAAKTADEMLMLLKPAEA
jgi:copper chaperone CopZ